MNLTGEVVEVRFRNLENFYTIVYVDTGLNIEACVGYFPDVNVGEYVSMEGQFIENKMYGTQFEVETVVVQPPNNKMAMIQYLSSGLFPGIGPKMAEKIVANFQDKTIEVLSSDPNKLAQIKGINLKKAKEVVSKFISQEHMRGVLMYLQGYGVTLSMAMKLYLAYGDDVQKILEKNPYKIVEDVDGIGFKTADTIAMKMGIAFDSEFRIQAAITYILTEVANKNGHTYLYYRELVGEIISLLRLEVNKHQDLIETCIRKCEDDCKIVIDEKNDQKLVMSYSIYLKERDIAKKLVKLLNSSTKNILADIDADILEYEQVNHISLDTKQKEAVKNSLMYGVSIITGGPGTGKTTIIKAIISILKKLNKTFKLCAPTGRAAKRLSESTLEPASTIHRALGLAVVDNIFKFEYNETKNLTEDVIIVDEVSMCDVYIMESLLAALKNSARVIFVGDKDQLPSVGAGNILSDMINSKVIPVSYLSRIYRQGEKSMISFNAHEVNMGRMISLKNDSSDFFFKEAKDSEDAVKQAVSMVENRLPKFYHLSQDDIQVLAPGKKGIAGVENLNKVFQRELNKNFEEQEIKYGNNVFKVGDKVIHIKNDYELNYVTKMGVDGMGVFNGEMGKIVYIDENIPIIKVEFDDEKIATYTRKEFDELQLAYAITVHKSQGSEFKIVVFIAMENSYMLVTRNLLYTGITRGKQVVVIVGSKAIIAKMIGNNKIDKRNSRLLDFLRAEADFNLDN